MLSKIRKWS